MKKCVFESRKSVTFSICSVDSIISNIVEKVDLLIRNRRMNKRNGSRWKLLDLNNRRNVVKSVFCRNQNQMRFRMLFVIKFERLNCEVQSLPARVTIDIQKNGLVVEV